LSSSLFGCCAKITLYINGRHLYRRSPVSCIPTRWVHSKQGPSTGPAHTHIKFLMDRFINHPRELGDSCRAQTETPSKAHPRAQAHTLIKFSWIDLLIIQGNWGTPVGPRNYLRPMSPAHSPKDIPKGLGCQIYIKDSGIISHTTTISPSPSPLLSLLQLTSPSEGPHWQAPVGHSNGFFSFCRRSSSLEGGRSHCRKRTSTSTSGSLPFFIFNIMLHPPFVATVASSSLFVFFIQLSLFKGSGLHPVFL
jgi:hypothetical protein